VAGYHCKAVIAGDANHRQYSNSLVAERSLYGACAMSEKLGIGDTFPKLTLNLVDDGRLGLPDGVDGKYRIFLFYRGHW
jgi:hypothetical protein